MPSVAIEITRFVDEYQPGIVECTLVDALGNTHSFVEKAPIVSDKDLWSTSTYPCLGEINCEIEEEWQDDDGRSLVRISTDQPWHVESTNGENKFVVLLSQMVQT